MPWGRTRKESTRSWKNCSLERFRRLARAIAGEVAVVAGELPRLASVVRAPELAAVGVAAFPGDTITRLDERVDAVRIVLAHA